MKLVAVDVALHAVSEGTALLDVRAPVEFAKGSFPGAVNIPLLDDRERAAVGTRYRSEGQDAAIALGHELVRGSTKEDRVSRWQHFFAEHSASALFCLRGGLRSQIVQEWLAESGVLVPRVEGGFKAMRRRLLERFAQRLVSDTVLRLGGPTGAAKTRLLTQLINAVDLEHHARHRGSAFGALPGGQPAQMDFEHALSLDWLARDVGTLIVEDESRNIGSRHLPASLWEKMRSSPLVVLEADLEARVAETRRSYVVDLLDRFPGSRGERFEALRDHLLDALQNIARRLGDDRYPALRKQLIEAWKRHRESGEETAHDGWIRRLLVEYYDPRYAYGLGKSREQIVFQGSWNEVLAYLRA